jgi:hypothetical protein
MPWRARARADEDALFRVLRLPAGVGLFDEVAPRCFALTDLGAGLRSDVPSSIRTSVINNLDDSRWQAWGQLLLYLALAPLGDKSGAATIGARVVVADS